MIMRKFREFAKRRFNKDIKITAVEVRDIMRQAFAGTAMSGRTGFSSLLAPGMIPGENLTSFAGFDRYAMNWFDRLYHAIGAKLLPFERFERAYLSTPDAIDIDRMHQAGGFDLPFGRKVLFNFMSHFSAFKSRAADLIANAREREKKYANSFKGKDYDQATMSKVGLAIYTLQRMFYETTPEFRARWEQDLADRAARVGKPPRSKKQLDALWARKTKKIFNDAKISGMTINDAVLAMAEAIRAGHLTGVSAEDAIKLGSIAVVYRKSLVEVSQKLDPEDRADAEALVEAMGLILVSSENNTEYTGPMVESLRYVWDAAKEMAEVSAESGLMSAADLQEFHKYMTAPMVAPGGSARSFRGIGGLSYAGGNRFGYEEGDSQAASAQWPDAASATFTALRRRHVEAEINKAVTTLFNFAAYNPLPAVFDLIVQDDLVDEFQRTRRGMKFGSLENQPNRGAVISKMAQDGILMMSSPDISKETPTTIRQQKSREQREGLIPVYINGQLNYMKIKHAELARSFNLHFRPTRSTGIVKVLAGVNRWLISMATLLSPEFWLSNLPRDMSMALGVLAMQGRVAGKDGVQFAKDSAKLIPHAMRFLFAKNFKKDTSGIKHAELFEKYYADFKHGGEIQWAFQETGIATMRGLESRIRMAQKKGTKMDHYLSTKESFVDFMQKISGSFENTTRFVVFCAAREAGVANDKAVMMARNVTVDFDKKGAYGELFNTFYMFANAGIQANINIAKLMRNNPGRAAKAAGGIIALSFGMAMMNFLIGGSGDDDESWYGSIPQQTRNSHIIAMLPFTDGVPLKIPFAYGLSFFWGIGQELASFMFTRNSAGQAAAGVLSSLMNNFNPLETAAGLGDVHGWVRMLSPTIGDPIVDLSFEKTPFGTPLMPTATFEGQPDSARHWRSVSSISKSLAKTMNDWTFGSAGESGLVDISPETLDYMYETATGGLGKFLVRTIGAIISPATGKEVTVNDIPGIRRFVGGQPKWEARGRFNNNYDQVLGAYATFRELRDAASMAKDPSVKAQAIKDRDDFRAENLHILKLRDRANDTLKKIKGVDKLKERLHKSGLSDKEIMPKLRKLDDQQRDIFSDFNRIYYQTVDMN